MNFQFGIDEERYSLNRDSSSRKSLSSIGVEGFQFFKEEADVVDTAAKIEVVSTEKSLSSQKTPQVSILSKHSACPSELVTVTPSSQSRKIKGLFKLRKKGSSLKEKNPRKPKDKSSPQRRKLTTTQEDDDDMNKILQEYRKNQESKEKRCSPDTYFDFDSAFLQDVPQTLQRCLTISNQAQNEYGTEQLDENDLNIETIPGTLVVGSTEKHNKMMERLFKRLKGSFTGKNRTLKRKNTANVKDYFGSLPKF